MYICTRSCRNIKKLFKLLSEKSAHFEDRGFLHFIKLLLMKKRIIVINLKEFFHVGIDKPFSILSELESIVYNLDSYTESIEIEYMNGIFEFVFQELRIDKTGLVIVKYKVNL